MAPDPEPAGPLVTARAADTRVVRLALVALVTGAATLGFSPILVRLSELAPTATAFHRVFLALPALWVWQHLESDRRSPVGRPRSARDFAGLALAGLFFAGDLAFWHWSLQFTSVANATLLATFAPIYVTLGSFLLFGERFSRLFLVGMALAIAGAGVLMGRSFTVSVDNLFGDVLGAITGVFFGLYILTVGRLRARLTTATIMLWSTAACALALLPVTMVAGEGFLAATARGWLVLAALALVVHVVGQGLIAYALAHLPAAFSSVSLLIEPTVAALLAWMLFAEALGPLQIVGALVILVGIYLCRRASAVA